MQGISAEVVDGLTAIGQSIDSIRGVASAVEQQSAVTAETSTGMHGAAQGVAGLGRNLEALASRWRSEKDGEIFQVMDASTEDEGIPVVDL